VIADVAVAPESGAGSIDGAMLADALETECRLLNDLITVLQMQRNGVAGDDADAVDYSVIAAHRVMRTLDEARKRRRAIVGFLAADENTPISELEDVPGLVMTPRIESARRQLYDHARRVAREIEINRRILRGAMEHGDRFIKALCASPMPSTYEPARRTGAQPATVHGSVLINQSV
jgi:FlgN protein